MMTIVMPAISGQLEICGSSDWNYLLGELFVTLNFRKQYVSCVKSFLSRFYFVGKIQFCELSIYLYYTYSDVLLPDVLSKYLLMPNLPH